MKLNYRQKKYIDNVLLRLSKSKFRSSFHLRKYMIEYIDKKGLNIIENHAYDFIIKNLAPAFPVNDGRQTPTKNHPVFIAQHACGCCCRKCLEKWHNIPRGRLLNDREVKYLVALILVWIEKEYYLTKNSNNL